MKSVSVYKISPEFHVLSCRKNHHALDSNSNCTVRSYSVSVLPTHAVLAAKIVENKVPVIARRIGTQAAFHLNTHLQCLKTPV